jgi:hypothetical protein
MGRGRGAELLLDGSYLPVTHYSIQLVKRGELCCCVVVFGGSWVGLWLGVAKKMQILESYSHFAPGFSNFCTML